MINFLHSNFLKTSSNGLSFVLFLNLIFILTCCTFCVCGGILFLLLIMIYDLAGSIQRSHEMAEDLLRRVGFLSRLQLLVKVFDFCL